MLAIPVLPVAQPRSGAPRFGQPSQEQPRPFRNTRGSAPGPLRAPGPGRTAGRARAEVPRRIPAPLGSSSGPGFFPGPGRVFHSTVWLRKDGDALGAQGAGCGHKSPCGPSFPLLTRGGSRLASRPGRTGCPAFPVWRSGDCEGSQARSIPFRRRGTGLAHSVPSHPSPQSPDLRWPGPHRIAARGRAARAGHLLL